MPPFPNLFVDNKILLLSPHPLLLKWHLGPVWNFSSLMYLSQSFPNLFVDNKILLLPPPPLLLKWHLGPVWTFASLMYLSQSALFCDLFCQFLILQLFPRLINPFPLPKSIPPCLTVRTPQFRFPNSSQPGGPVHRTYKTGGRVAQLYPQAPGTHISHLLRPTCAAEGRFFSPVTRRGVYSKLSPLNSPSPAPSFPLSHYTWRQNNTNYTRVFASPLQGSCDG